MTINKDRPLVSIVMATYNGELFLHQQLDSLVQQTYPNLEIIVVDDGSRDSTTEILKEYAARYANIKLFFNSGGANLGYIKNFEKGCGLASGDYISFCDQDDVWALDKTARLMEAVGDYPMAYCDAELVDGQLNSLHKNRSDSKNLKSYNNCLYFAADNCVGGHAMIIKKTLFTNASPFPTAMPHDLWLAFASTVYGGMQYLDAPLVKWREHGNNVTSGQKSKKEKLVETCRRMQIFHDFCKPEMVMEKKVLRALLKSYQPYPLTNNFLRMTLYFRYQHYLLAMKKRNAVRKFLFCLKMLFQRRLHVC
jgi:glycosyltransferase involved in cell wall biosynthesis